MGRNSQPKKEYDLVEFEFTAVLMEGPESFRGAVIMRNPKSKHLPTERECAWAHVRGMLCVPGMWACAVKIPFCKAEHRRIEVQSVEGALFRRDITEVDETTPTLKMGRVDEAR